MLRHPFLLHDISESALPKHQNNSDTLYLRGYGAGRFAKKKTRSVAGFVKMGGRK